MQDSSYATARASRNHAWTCGQGASSWYTHTPVSKIFKFACQTRLKMLSAHRNLWSLHCALPGLLLGAKQSHGLVSDCARGDSIRSQLDPKQCCRCPCKLTLSIPKYRDLHHAYMGQRAPKAWNAVQSSVVLPAIRRSHYRQWSTSCASATVAPKRAL